MLFALFIILKLKIHAAFAGLLLSFVILTRVIGMAFFNRKYLTIQDKEDDALDALYDRQPIVMTKDLTPLSVFSSRYIRSLPTSIKQHVTGKTSAKPFLRDKSKAKQRSHSRSLSETTSYARSTVGSQSRTTETKRSLSLDLKKQAPSMHETLLPAQKVAQAISIYPKHIPPWEDKPDPSQRYHDPYHSELPEGLWLPNHPHEAIDLSDCITYIGPALVCSEGGSGALVTTNEKEPTKTIISDTEEPVSVATPMVTIAEDGSAGDQADSERPRESVAYSSLGIAQGRSQRRIASDSSYVHFDTARTPSKISLRGLAVAVTALNQLKPHDTEEEMRLNRARSGSAASADTKRIIREAVLKEEEAASREQRRLAESDDRAEQQSAQQEKAILEGHTHGLERAMTLIRSSTIKTPTTSKTPLTPSKIPLTPTHRPPKES